MAASDSLVRLAARGDREALTRLVLRLLPRVRNLVRYLIRGDRDVDDVAQEAVVAVLRGLGTYRGQGSFESWADRVTARATFAWLRKRRADEARELEVARLEATHGDDGAAPDEYACRRQAVRLLDALPLEQRHVLVLHHVVGMSVSEVADHLGAPAETVRSRLRLAKQRLLSLGSSFKRQEAG